MTFRQTLHQLAELSNQEHQTAAFVAQKLKLCNPTALLTAIGGTGIVAIWKGEKAGKSICFRAELDALPIEEANDFAHQSLTKGVSHKCGHDGHMAILLEVAAYLKENRPTAGNVILLFQPAEEIGAGALQVLEDERFKALSIDYIFALHNLPHYPLHQVVVRKGIFATASVGICITLEGKTAHAGEPENGINPVLALSELATFLYTIHKTTPHQDFVLSTVVHARLGEKSFGVSPAKAEVCATFRSYSNEDLAQLCLHAEEKAKALALQHHLLYKISYIEKFSATQNSDMGTKAIQEVATKLGLESVEKKEPFRWSEDFGQFTQRYQGAMFGLGAGLHSAELHQADYDFPDALIKTGSDIFIGLLPHFLG